MERKLILSFLFYENYIGERRFFILIILYRLINYYTRKYTRTRYSTL